MGMNFSVPPQLTYMMAFTNYVDVNLICKSELYFFDKVERNKAVVCHGFIKKSNKQQDDEIERARICYANYSNNPDAYTFSKTE